MIPNYSKTEKMLVIPFKESVYYDGAQRKGISNHVACSRYPDKNRSLSNMIRRPIYWDANQRIEKQDQESF